MSSWNPPASIIINTYNRAEHLDDALRSLAGLDYSPFEVVVVNGPSTDCTEDVLASWGDGIKVRHCAEANLSKSRNIGIAAASGEIICFIDDDASPHPAWLSHLARAYADSRVGAVGGFTIDNTGMRWQVRKTVCDRFGNAHNVSHFFDERGLNRRGTGFYPSLLGTNCSFRASALKEIGGFDEAFAYMLDETDVCLRMVDAGWLVHYEPDALVFHQFAESHIRSQEKIPRTLYPSARSKAYFIMTHGMKHDVKRAGQELHRYREEIGEANRWLADNRKISARHRFSLDEDLSLGIAEGVALATAKAGVKSGDLVLGESLTPFLLFPRNPGAMRIALVSRGFPPANDTGIARWTRLLAEGLAKRGHQVHVLTESHTGDETIRFRGGIWVHELSADPASAPMVIDRYDVPEEIAKWAARVILEVRRLKGFGLKFVSFPIWDLEGLPVLDEPDIIPIVSLHTTYAMARPFKPEWAIRPLLEHAVVNKVVAAERAVFERAPVLLANSHAIIQQIERDYGVSISDRARLVPHGTPDPLSERAAMKALRDKDVAVGAPLRVLFVGRFELRKGFDIAVQVAHGLMEVSGIEFRFVGDKLGESQIRTIEKLGAGIILSDPRIDFAGVVSRRQLDDALVSADLILMPSRFESFGLVAIEAMAAGRPVLALKAGGLAEVVTVEAGGTAIEDGPDVAACFVDEIVALNQNRAQLELRGQMARKMFERNYSSAMMAEGVEAILAELQSQLADKFEKSGVLTCVD